MNTYYVFYAADRYWPERKQLELAYNTLTERLGCSSNSCLMTDDSTNPLPQCDCIVIVPMSGAVQKKILNTASQYDISILYGAYIEGNVPYEISQHMMRANAAPTLMDTWAVLRRGKSHTLLALCESELADKLRIASAYCHVRGAKVLKIGETEPWVVSNATSQTVYEDRFGIEIIPVEQDELEALFLSATNEQAAYYYEWFSSRACNCVEPNEQDLWNASKMAYALMVLMDKYKASAAALACFNLLRTGTTACMGVSYINNSTEMCVSCEGDVDSAITMLLMKKLTDHPMWMANPNIHPGGIINFNHCTSPISCSGFNSSFSLRSHHESGIGVSLQVEMPHNAIVTACRISNEASQMTIHRGITENGPYETACRTQMYVRFDDFSHYLETALGCHQVFAFEDISKLLVDIGKLFDLQIL